MQINAAKIVEELKKYNFNGEGLYQKMQKKPNTTHLSVKGSSIQQVKPAQNKDKKKSFI